MGELKVVGKSVPRVDALDKVTGGAKYCSDFKVPWMLHGKILRSSYPHARIVSIDTARAEKLPGVRAVVTGKDAPNIFYGRHVLDCPILASDIVRFVGEPMAAVAADTAAIAEEALDLIEVIYEELPAVFDVEEASMKNPPVILHPNQIDYVRLPRPNLSPIQLEPDMPNVFNHYKVRRGDIESGFQEADLIIENRYSTARVQHCHLEPQVVIAQLESDGGLTVITSRQGIYPAKATLAEYLNLPISKIRVISPYVGGGFGEKLSALLECITALLAQKSRKPVRVAFTREEVFISGNAPNLVIYLRDGVKKDGTLVAREVRILLDAGAYAANTATAIVAWCASEALATYKIQAFKLDSYGVYTNKPPVCPMRGVGTPQVAYALEQQMDIIAEKVSIDAVKLRTKNLLSEGEINLVGETVRSIGVKGCLDKVAEWLGNIRTTEADGVWKIGKGLAIGNLFTMAGLPSTAIVKVHSDGVIEVRHAIEEIGQGINTVLSQIAAEEFGISVDSVKVVSGDTAIVPYDFGPVSSRSTLFAGNAVLLACRDAKSQLFELAAPMLKVCAEELEIKEGKVYVKGTPERVITINSLFSRMGHVKGIGEILGRGEFNSTFIPIDPETGQSEKFYDHYSYGANGVVIAVEEETGEVKVLKVAGCFDMGQPINPKMCEGQIEGGAGMGIGTTLYEELSFSEGAILNPNFADYKIPTTMDLPIVENTKSMIAGVPYVEGPFGAKGLGEMTQVPLAPAIANAFFNATGVRIKDLPFSRERVLKALKEVRKA